MYTLAMHMIFHFEYFPYILPSRLRILTQFPGFLHGVSVAICILYVWLKIVEARTS